MARYSKAIVAALGAAITAALGLIPDHQSSLWIVLTILAAAMTTVGVYSATNTPPGPIPPAGGAF